MFCNGQIVFDCTKQQPCVAYSSKRETHFIKSEGKLDRYTIALPKNVKEARKLMKQARIFPAPLPESHCCRCFNWNENHRKGFRCWRENE